MDLKLIKAGHTGFGYLIEHDAGYISPSDPKNQSLIREFKKLDLDQKNPDTLIVYVVLQKYGVKNRNGRIYPEEILTYVVKNIIQECCSPQYCISDQFSSVAQSCPTLCDPMNRSTPGLPVHH